MTSEEKDKRLNMAYCVLGQLMVQYEIRGLELQDRIKELEDENRRLSDELGKEKCRADELEIEKGHLQDQNRSLLNRAMKEAGMQGTDDE